MKYIILTLTLLSLTTFAKRKVSNTSYYYCSIERNGEYNKNYRNEFVLPLIKDNEEYEIRKSKRWNKVIVTVTTDFKLKVLISEEVMGQNNEVEKVLNPQGLSYNNPVRLDEEFKFKVEDKEIIYRLQCE